jgi:hypothetical protein
VTNGVTGKPSRALTEADGKQLLNKVDLLDLVHFYNILVLKMKQPRGIKRVYRPDRSHKRAIKSVERWGVNDLSTRRREVTQGEKGKGNRTRNRNKKSNHLYDMCNPKSGNVIKANRQHIHNN